MRVDDPGDIEFVNRIHACEQRRRRRELREQLSEWHCPAIFELDLDLGCRQVGGIPLVATPQAG
jgi:hypothetical protein